MITSCEHEKTPRLSHNTQLHWLTRPSLQRWSQSQKQSQKVKVPSEVAAQNILSKTARHAHEDSAMLGLPLCAAQLKLSDLGHRCIYQVLTIVSHYCVLTIGSSVLSSSGKKDGKNQPSGSKQRLPQTPVDT